MRQALPGVTATVVLLSTAIAAYGQVCPTGWDCACMVQTPYPPPGAAWAAVHNPSFENGFTGGVGNYWIAAYQNFSSTPTYLDSTQRATHGTHSQRITIPEIALGSGYNSQRAGIYQQIYVVPGQSYTVTVQVYMELDSSEAYSGEKMVAHVGIDPYGATSIGEGSVKWSVDEGTKGQWKTVSVTATAVFEVITVYASGMLKWENTEQGRIWIDNFTVSGPVPTQNPSPPEEDWIDPDLSIPATTGGEKVANGSFEGSWSNGVAASWSTFSTAGTGYWRQSTLVGPIGGGKYDFSTPETIRDLNPRVALSSVVGDADNWAAQPNMADTVVVGRLVIPDEGLYVSNPAYYGPLHADHCKTEEGYHPRVDVWCGLNEPDWSDTNWANVLAFETAFTERCHQIGLKSLVLNMSVGSPGNIWKMLQAQSMLASADYVGYHTYGGQIDQLMISAANAQNDPCSFALRWRRYVDMYRDRGWRMPPVIYTEGTTYAGWHGVFSPAQIRDDLIALGPFMLQDRWTVGLALFCAGCNGTWEDWDIQGQGDIAAACGAWNQANPTEATAGLYSQQFGAGTLHPTTTTQLQNPAGAFTGGIKQQITSLVAGKTYLLDMDFRYEFRGSQPQVSFYTGVDLTGQTSNPNAGTIGWSADLITAEPANHDTWERTWRTFTASGTTASVWLMGLQTVNNPTYRISVDRVSVKQVDDGSVVPTIALTPASINVSAPTGTNPPNGSFTVRNSGTGTLSYSISDNATWLSCSPTSGTSTGETDTITITYATSSLVPGSYNATITVSDPNASNNPQTIPVALTVSTPVSVAEDFEAMPTWSSTYDAPWGGAASWSVVAGGQSANCLQVNRSNDGSSVKAKLYNITANTSYTLTLYARCPSGTATYWSEAGCKLGSFSAQDFDDNGATWTMIKKFSNDTVNGNGDVWTQYTVNFNSGANTQVSVAYKLGRSGGTAPTVKYDTLRITPPGGVPTINRSPATLAPACVQGQNASSQTFTVSNSGAGTLNYSITDNVTWLSCSPASGTSTGEADTITVTYATSGLTAGTHNATITISDPAATNNPQTIAVTLTVSPPPPTITRAPATLAPSCTQGSNASNQTFTVQNTGGGTLNYSISDNQTWLSCSPATGTSTGETDTITVSYTTSGLAVGTHNATITISDPNATNNPQTIAVTLTVNKKTVAEDFTTVPSWTSSFDAGWGGAATWSAVSGGQSGNCLQATRSNTGSSAKVKVYNISPNQSYTLSVYMKCPSSAASYWRECFYKLGSYTAQDYDQNGGTWTEVKKFANPGTNGNGDAWVQYSKTFNSGANTQISVGFKTGNSSGTAPTIKWDTLRVQ